MSYFSSMVGGISGFLFGNANSNNSKRKRSARRQKRFPNHFKKGENVNILLLGSTGVGKSTFINSLANYLVYGNFSNAQNKRLLRLIQVKVPIGMNEIVIGEDDNEKKEIGASSTQNVKSYSFPLEDGKINLRLIDTPGLADTRGLLQDEVNCEYILEHIATMEHLHAICILMRAGIDRISVEFEYCIRQILSRLEKSATQNIIFVITNTSGREYKGGETINCLRKFVDDIKGNSPDINIPVVEGRNIYCVDNEGFQYLACQQSGNAMPGDVQKFVKSWNVSSANCWSMLNYILGGGGNSQPLKPHKVQNSVSINEARRMIVQLQKPLTEITQLINDNVGLLESQEEKLKDGNQTLEELKKHMFIPHINMKTVELKDPVTVCASARCAKITAIEDKEMWNYEQKCHNPCGLNDVQREIVGDPALKGCWAMNGKTNCRVCECDYTEHMHIYYECKVFDDKLEDKNAIDSISTKEEALEAASKTVEQIKTRKNEFEEEREFIVNSTAQLIHFLQNNAITPFDDSVKAYIQHLMRREMGRGVHKNAKKLEGLRNLLKKYEEDKAAYEKAVDDVKNEDGHISRGGVTAEKVFETIKRLFHLRHFGAKIKDVYEKQKNCIKSEQSTRPMDYKHSEAISTANVIAEEIDYLVFVNY